MLKSVPGVVNVEVRLGDLEFIELIGLGDLHVGHEAFDGDKFLSILEWLDERPNRFAVLNGDLFEMAIRNSKGNPHRSMSPADEKRYLLKHLLPRKDKFLAVVDGNHEERMSRDTDMSPAEDLAIHLGVPYAPAAAVLKVRFGMEPKHKDRPLTYRGYITHGWAGGRQSGSAINAIEKLVMVYDADFYIVGHTHKPVAAKVRRLWDVPHTGAITFRERAFISSGSCLGWATYAARRGLPPTSLDYPILTLDGRAFRMEVRQ